MSEKCVHEWYYRIVDIVSWQFFCIRCGEKLSMDKFSNHASDLEKNADALNARIAELEHRNKVLEDACEMLRKENGRVTQLLVFGKGLSTNGSKVQI